MPKSLKRSHSPRLAPNNSCESSQRSKKLKLQTSYATESPFPHFAHPSREEAYEVFNILSKAHGGINIAREGTSRSENSAASSCGDVPNVIEALLGTILSQNTSGKNSSAAKANLDAKFGRNNFPAIADAPREEVVDAIRQGGLANKKAATIQKILRSIKEKHGDYSLQHMAGIGPEARANDEITRELISYDGVGPKTASCVLLFCLGRDSFAVDTHVYRLSKLLGWIPDNADRVLAQAHLDLRVPAELKYGLHVLMIRHGRSCKGCKNTGGRDCILKTYLKSKRTGSICEQAAGEISL